MKNVLITIMLLISFLAAAQPGRRLGRNERQI